LLFLLSATACSTTYSHYAFYYANVTPIRNADSTNQPVYHKGGTPGDVIEVLYCIFQSITGFNMGAAVHISGVSFHGFVFDCTFTSCSVTGGTPY
jgi:hypothetical protein